MNSRLSIASINRRDRRVDAMAAMTKPGLKVGDRLALAGRRFHAWWEGLEFDEETERAALVSAIHSTHAHSEHHVAQAIWGAGRLSPGTPAWTMRFARMLALPLKSEIVVFGADAGAPLQDLKRGAKWKVTGYTRAEEYCGGPLKSFQLASQKLQKATAAGALCFFELSAEPDPSPFLHVCHEVLLPTSKVVFLDFAVARRGAKLRSCFPGPAGATPRSAEEYQKSLESNGFSVNVVIDETASFLPMVSEGWIGWRKSYQALAANKNFAERAQMLQAFAAHAHLWAERHDALKSGQLRVLRIQASRD